MGLVTACAALASAITILLLVLQVIVFLNIRKIANGKCTPPEQKLNTESEQLLTELTEYLNGEMDKMDARIRVHLQRYIDKRFDNGVGALVNGVQGEAPGLPPVPEELKTPIAQLFDRMKGA